jgi:uncharacterized protein (TIGR01777 family)
MNILVSGSHGLIGSALLPALRAKGQTVIRLVRAPSSPADGVPWDPARGSIDAARLAGLDAVIHLAGEDISGGRWTPERKARIRDSRVRGTRLLAESLGGLPRPPRVLLSASAVGYYGHRGDMVLREEDPPGTGFLADLCREWEAAAEPARRAGIRVVYLRTGVVLSPAGGALAKILPIFRLGLGGPIGSGRQYMSWISIDDVVGALQHLLADGSLAGAVNLVAPGPVTNAEFTRALGQALSRPTMIPVPAGALRALFGEMADDALLSSTRAEPGRLLASGYAFHFPEVGGALRHLLRAPRQR